MIGIPVFPYVPAVIPLTTIPPAGWDMLGWNGLGNPLWPICTGTDQSNTIGTYGAGFFGLTPTNWTVTYLPVSQDRQQACILVINKNQPSPVFTNDCDGYTHTYQLNVKFGNGVSSVEIPTVPVTIPCRGGFNEPYALSFRAGKTGDILEFSSGPFISDVSYAQVFVCEAEHYQWTVCNLVPVAGITRDRFRTSIPKFRGGKYVYMVTTPLVTVTNNKGFPEIQSVLHNGYSVLGMAQDFRNAPSRRGR